MSPRVYRSIIEPIRENPSYVERWKGPDNGLITAWEVGREKGIKYPYLAERAKKGELPILGWKGGVDKKIKKKEKYGCLYYLAQWQGLREEDLDINTSEEKEIVCSKTGIKVIYTADSDKSDDP